MHADVEAVLVELDDHRERFEAFCRSLADEELDRPVPASDWLVRDFIAHLATIDGPVTEMFTTMLAGGDPGLRTGDGERWDVDRWNEHQVQDRRDQSVEALLDEAARARARLREAMLRFDEESLARTFTFAGDGKRPPGQVRIGQYLRGYSKHDPIHAVDMLRALPERRTPALDAWLDDPIVQGYQAAMNR